MEQKVSQKKSWGVGQQSERKPENNGQRLVCMVMCDWGERFNKALSQRYI